MGPGGGWGQGAGWGPGWTARERVKPERRRPGPGAESEEGRDRVRPGGGALWPCVVIVSIVSSEPACCCPPVRSANPVVGVLIPIRNGSLFDGIFLRFIFGRN